MSADEERRLARVALTWLAEPGTRAVHHRVERLGLVATLDLLLDGGSPDGWLHTTVAARSAAGDARAVAAEALERADRLGARLVTPDDEEWPARVAGLATLQLPDVTRRVDGETAPPLCFWVRGGWPLGEALDRSVAVVGARAATGYGQHVATELGYGLAERDWTVVSGGAFGIDAAAHRGALNAGGLTVAVLACGLDRPYPMGNAALFDRIADTGLLVSEWPPGAEPLRPRFLIRNRVIAGGTLGTVVVEASARSGATQTARRAIYTGRVAMVVPGPVTSAMSVGAHELLREFPRPGWSPGWRTCWRRWVGSARTSPRWPVARSGPPTPSTTTPGRCWRRCPAEVRSAWTGSPPAPVSTYGPRCASCPSWKSCPWWSVATMATPSPHPSHPSG